MRSSKLNPPGSLESFASEAEEADGYGSLEASMLLCPNCLEAMPVRKRLLLVLPEGEKYEYLCSRCSSTCGTKVEP